MRRSWGELDEGEEAVTADPNGLRHFLEPEVLRWFENRKEELANRHLIREQVFGEALDPQAGAGWAGTRPILTVSSSGCSRCCCASRICGWGRSRDNLLGKNRQAASAQIGMLPVPVRTFPLKTRAADGADHADAKNPPMA